MEARRGWQNLGFCGAFGVFFAFASSAQDAAPLSAIDWLSDSISVPAVEPPPVTDIPLATLPSNITVLPLDTPTPDSVGLQPASDLNLDAGLWGRSSAADLARALMELPDGADAPPALRRFLTRLLTSEFDPPIDAAIDDSFFLARVDRLLAAGQLGKADALIELAGTTEAERFRRSFDIALLRGTETEACQIVETTPELLPTYPTRIFCLARLGQWDVAALTLRNAEALGILTPEEDALLLHFLDPELFEGEDIPAPPRVPTPLLFRLFEAVGERIPTDQLPVAFAFADLGSTVGWQARLRATERLIATEALSFEQAIPVFRERKPAASGGIWERVGALQALLAALDKRDLDTLNNTLSAAWNVARRGGFEAAMAEWVTPRLTDYDLSGSAKDAAFEMALFSGDLDQAEAFVSETPEDQFLLALAQGQGSAVPGANPLNQSILRGLGALSPGRTFEALVRDDRSGEALFRALEALKRGAVGNPRATRQSLALLRQLGLGDLARQVAVELILIDGAA